MSFRLDLVREDDLSLLTDFYEFTMCASYFESRRNEIVTFDLFIRKFPPKRSYFIFAGIEQIVLFLENLRFDGGQLEYLGKQGFGADFLEYLRDFRFTGEVCSVPEGSVVFPNEPLIRVTAPMIEAQVIETFLLNTVNLQTMLATKASRVVLASKGRSVVEFGLRRTQGVDAGMKAARCSYMVGADGTSNVLAGLKYGIPLFGTMAHSYVMFFDHEIDSFRAFVESFPRASTLLIDTYDDVKGAENAAQVGKEIEMAGGRLSAVRLDSGDLAKLSRKVRRILDERGLEYVKIFASGDLDEYVIRDLLRKGAKIDGFGVGTRMSTSFDRPYIDVVYKLAGKVENDRFVPAMKLSKGKMTLPGKKQIFRLQDEGGKFVKDTVGLEDEELAGEPLLAKVMDHGKIVRELPSLAEIRRDATSNLSRLPDRYKRLTRPSQYPVMLSPQLEAVRKKLIDQLKRGEGSESIS